MRVLHYNGFGADLDKLSFQNDDYRKCYRNLLNPYFLKQAVTEFNQTAKVPLTLLITHNHHHNIYLFNKDASDKKIANSITLFLQNIMWDEFSTNHEDIPYLEEEFKQGIANELIRHTNSFDEVLEYELVPNKDAYAYPTTYEKFELAE